MTSFALRLGQAMALGRVAIGVSALAAPTLLARPWIGDGAARQDARLLARTMGGRDVALGLGALRALSRDRTDEARIWVGLGGMADAVDATVTVLAFRRLPRVTRWAILGATVGAAVASFRVAEELSLDPGQAAPAQPVPVVAPAAADPVTAPSDR
mgnify:CR=1 FL=1